jgi:hypothetical protein
MGKSVPISVKRASEEHVMKRILRISVLTAAIVAAVSAVTVTPAFQGQTQAGPIVNFLNGGYYNGPGYGYGYGYGYGGYPVYGQGPYAYGGYRANDYQGYGAGPYGYGAPNYSVPTYGQYRRTFYGPNGTMTYHGPYGYGFYNNGY